MNTVLGAPPQVIRGSFSPLQDECERLVALGINPSSVAATARTLEFDALLIRCFPRMPLGTREALLDGSASLILDQFKQWRVIYAEQ